LVEVFLLAVVIVAPYVLLGYVAWSKRQ